MGKEFTADKAGKTEFQPVTSVKSSVEDAASGTETAPSVDAMGTVPNHSDRQENSWSETSKNKDNVDVTHSYSRVPMDVNSGMLTQIDSKGDRLNTDYLSYKAPGELKATVQGDDPSNGCYHKDKYKTKTATELPAVSVPTFDRLVAKDPQGTQVDFIQGTLQRPNLTRNIDQRTLFINGTATADDIHQGNLNDCYFLAAILQIIHYDPSKIVNMMSLVGDDVTTKFYYKKDGKWSPVTITTKLGFIQKDGFTMGAAARVDLEPKTGVWSSSIESNTLKINRDLYYEAALWVNCIEQAFTVFASQYGQYGEGFEAGRSREKFEAIEFGWSGRCLHMFYGDDASDSKKTATSSIAPGVDIVNANANVISDLLELAKSQDGKSQTDYHIMAGTFPATICTRLGIYYDSLENELTAACQAAPNDAGLNQSLNDMKNFKYNYDLYAQFLANNKINYNAIKYMNAAAKSLEQNPSFKNAGLPSYDVFKTLVGSLVQTPGENLFMFTGHAYNVESVRLIGRNNENLNHSNINTVLASVDPKKSMLKVQNPHGKNKATTYAPETRTGKGDFDMTLEAFLANVDVITTATVKHGSDK